MQREHKHTIDFLLEQGNEAFPSFVHRTWSKDSSDNERKCNLN
jgi:hypothetical protein